MRKNRSGIKKNDEMLMIVTVELKRGKGNKYKKRE